MLANLSARLSFVGTEEAGGAGETGGAGGAGGVGGVGWADAKKITTPARKKTLPPAIIHRLVLRAVRAPGPALSLIGSGAVLMSWVGSGTAPLPSVGFGAPH